jgi:DNA primase
MDVRPTPLDQIRELDLVSYLASLGYQPEYVRRDNDYWYLSPLRNEGKASFKVNRELNRWYDHGLSEGGNLIDFGLAYFHCSVRELMDKINVDPSFQQQG